MLTQKSIILLMCLHFLGDQILQIKAVQVVKNKSSCMLAAHVLTWGLCILPFSCFAGWLHTSYSMMFAYPLTLMGIHFCTEWFFGRVASAFYYDNKLRMFILLTMFENLVIMVSMVMLFNYFI